MYRKLSKHKLVFHNIKIMSCSNCNSEKGYCDIKCKYNLYDICSICSDVSQLMGDNKLLFDCENNHKDFKGNFIWSYCDKCYTLGKYIGHFRYIGQEEEDEEYGPIEYGAPRKIDYGDLSIFKWYCKVCDKNYTNMYCG